MHHRCPQNSPASKTQAAQPKPENPKLSHCPCTDRSTTVTGCSRIPSWHCSQRGGGAQAHLPSSHVTGERCAHCGRCQSGGGASGTLPSSRTERIAPQWHREKSLDEGDATGPKLPGRKYYYSKRRGLGNSGAITTTEHPHRHPARDSFLPTH
jgi:hypothetical protein